MSAPEAGSAAGILDEPEAPRVGRTRPRPAPGERDHGELSEHRAGPDAKRHGEDVVVLLGEQQSTARKRLNEALRARDQADRDITKWTADVDYYERMILAVRNVKPPKDGTVQ